MNMSDLNAPDVEDPYAGACAAEDEAARRFFQLAPTMAVGGSAEIDAEIVGHVQFRHGDGVLLTAGLGPIAVEVCSCDAVPSFKKPPYSMERNMSQRLDYYKASRDATNAMVSLEKSVTQFGFEPVLLELVRLRASQINGCAYCVDHHIAEAKKAGETDRRLHGVIVWRETPFFTPREQAALAWTESLTRLPDTHAPDEDYALVREQFSDKEIVDLTVAIIAVNGWNRLGVGFRRSPAN